MGVQGSGQTEDDVRPTKACTQLIGERPIVRADSWIDRALRRVGSVGVDVRDDEIVAEEHYDVASYSSVRLRLRPVVLPLSTAVLSSLLLPVVLVVSSAIA